MRNLFSTLRQEVENGAFRASLATLDRRKSGQIVQSFLYAFVPQWVRSRYFDDPVTIPDLTETSWIDGLRGVAMLCLFNYHFLYAFTDMPAWPFGIAEHTWLIELPIIRLPYMGRPMICIFLVTGGYLFSKAPLKLMRRGDTDAQSQVLQLLSRWTFRRYFRLYLPAVIMAFIVAVSVYAGAYDFSRPSMMDLEKYFPGLWKESHLTRFPTISEQLLLCWKESFRVAWVWEWMKYYPSEDDHLYLIRVVIQSSIGLSTTLVALSWMQESIRFMFLLILSAYWMRFERWETVLFLWGACIAHLNLLRDASDSEELVNNYGRAHSDVYQAQKLSKATQDSWGRPAPTLFWVRRLFSRWAWHIIFILSLYLMSAPTAWDQDGSALGYMFIFKAYPVWLQYPYAILPSIGSAMLFGCLTLCEPSSICHTLLKGKFVQYLGRTVFSTYLVHGPILHACGYMVPHLVWRYVDRGDLLPYCLGLAIGWSTSLILASWASDVFHREVDLRCLHFIDWLEDTCSMKTT